MKADLHAHTHFSRDAVTSVETFTRRYEAAGIDVVAVSDHNNIDGALAVREIAPFRVVLSEEIRTSEGEIIGFFLQETVRKGLTPEDTVRAIREQGGLVCVPHPFDRTRSSPLREEALLRILADVGIGFEIASVPELDAVLAHGVPYSLSVQTYSGIRLQAQLLQDSNEPGATLTVRAVLTEYGLPIPAGRATVRAKIERPDGSGGVVTLVEADAGSGVYAASTTAWLSGVYPIRVLADGSTLRGRDFTREHVLTGAVWKGGDVPPPTSKDDPQEEKDRLCRLLSCLLDEKVLRPDLERRLKDLGLDLDALRHCLHIWCQRPQPPSTVLPETPKPGIATGKLFPGATVGGATVLAAPRPRVTPKVLELICQLARELDEAQ